MTCLTQYNPCVWANYNIYKASMLRSSDTLSFSSFIEGYVRFNTVVGQRSSTLGCSLETVLEFTTETRHEMYFYTLALEKIERFTIKQNLQYND